MPRLALFLDELGLTLDDMWSYMRLWTDAGAWIGITVVTLSLIALVLPGILL